MKSRRKSLCRKKLSDKIRINLEEGKFPTRQQAIAVSYSQTMKDIPQCKSIFARSRKQSTRRSRSRKQSTRRSRSRKRASRKRASRKRASRKRASRKRASRKRASRKRASRKRASRKRNTNSKLRGGGNTPLTSIDMAVTQLIWEGSRLEKKLSREEKDFLQRVVTKYQLWVITSNRYRRPDAQNRARDIAKILGDPSLVSTSISGVHTAVEKSLTADLLTLLGPSYKTKQSAQQVKKAGVVYGGGDNFYDTEEHPTVGTDDVRNIQQDIRSRTVGYTRQQLFADAPDAPNVTETKNQLTQMQEFMIQMQERQESMQAEYFNQLNAKFENTNTSMDNERIVQVEKATKKMQEDMNEIMKMLMRNQDITGISFSRIPQWFREKAAQGVIRTAMGVAGLPFNAASVIINQAYVVPLMYAVNFWMNKIRLVWGSVLLVVTIAGVVNVLVLDKYGWVKEFQESAGAPILEEVFIKPGTYLVQSIKDMHGNALDGFGANLMSALYDAMGLAWQACREAGNYAFDWFKEALLLALEQIPGASMVMKTAAYTKSYF